MISEEFFRTFLPYCIQKTPSGRYVILNRSYKPVGTKSKDYVDYEPHAVKLKMTGRMAAGLSHNGSTDVNEIYLYDDFTNPSINSISKRKYMERLEKLINYKLTLD